MHRTDGNSFGLSGSKHIFRTEDGGGAHKATQLTTDMANAFQEEIANVIEGAGLTLNNSGEAIGSMNQLQTAIDNQRNAVETAAQTDRNLIWSKVDAVETAGNVTPNHAIGTLLRDAIKNWSTPRGYVDGLLLTNNGNLNITLTQGIAKSISDLTAIRLTSGTLDKQVINSGQTDYESWTSGDGGGGVPSGVGAIGDGKWLHCFVLANALGTVFNFGFDDSLTAVNLLADAGVSGLGLTEYRRIGSVKITGSSGSYIIAPFIQSKNMFLWNTSTGPIQDFSGTIETPTAIPLSTPDGVIVRVIANLAANNATAVKTIQYWDGVLGASAPAAAGQIRSNVVGESNILEAQLLTDTSRQIYAFNSATGGSVTFTVKTRGWIDPR